MTAQEQREFIQNINLGKTQITDKIRVSTAALHREEYFGSYWLIETWIFSDDPKQKNTQIIHGSPSSMNGEKPPCEKICEKARRIHAQISDSLRKKYVSATMAVDAEHGIIKSGISARSANGRAAGVANKKQLFSL